MTQLQLPNARQSQCERILEALKAGRRLNPLVSLNEFGCFRLGGRIFDLKKQGYDIKSEMVTLPNSKKVKEYWMEPSLMCRGNGHHNWSLTKETCECGELINRGGLRDIEW